MVEPVAQGSESSDKTTAYQIVEGHHKAKVISLIDPLDELAALNATLKNSDESTEFKPLFHQPIARQAEVVTSDTSADLVQNNAKRQTLVEAVIDAHIQDVEGQAVRPPFQFVP